MEENLAAETPLSTVLAFRLEELPFCPEARDDSELQQPRHAAVRAIIDATVSFTYVEFGQAMSRLGDGVGCKTASQTARCTDVRIVANTLHELHRKSTRLELDAMRQAALVRSLAVFAGVPPEMAQLSTATKHFCLPNARSGESGVRLVNGLEP